MTDPVTVRIAVIGVSATGKTAIVKRFIDDIFHVEYDCTIEETYVKSLVVDGMTYNLMIAGLFFHGSHFFLFFSSPFTLALC